MIITKYIRRHHHLQTVRTNDETSYMRVTGYSSYYKLIATLASEKIWTNKTAGYITSQPIITIM